MTYRHWAPRCAMEGCRNLVGYHKKYIKEDGFTGYKWKRACEEHRTVKKAAFDNFKMSRSCENRDGRYGFKCTATITNPAQIDIHHKDGDHYNNHQSNLECLCRNCHGIVTIQNGDHKNRYDNYFKLNKEIFDYD